MEFDELEKAIRASWDEQTCYPGWADDWTKENPAYGQCVVTALVVQDYYGGDLAFCKEHFHYWNILPNNKYVDLTREQFPVGTDFSVDMIRSRESILSGDRALKAKTKERYELLKNKIDKILDS